jgi:DNA polymerase III subunit gamma/tau
MLRFMAQNEDGSAGERYQVVARRFRPQTFQEMVGQEDVLRSLRSALQQKSVPHAFLFSGSRGVGKTTSARILARCLNCKKGPTPEPCGTCPSCVSILDGSNPDVIEIDAASNNGIEDVRRLRETAGYATMQSRYRVIVLDEAHMLSRSAFNALLKTLEEPPKQVVFVLATTELDRVPETIRSRCQVLLFRRVGEDDLQKRLRMIADKEGVGVPDEVLAEIALTVRGGVRDAETALERILPVAREMAGSFDLETYRSLVARLGTDVLIDVARALLAGDAKAGLHFAHEARQRGTDEAEALGELVEVLRWLMLLRIDGVDSSLVPLTGALRERLAALLQGDGGATIDTARLDAMIAAGLKGRERLRLSTDRAVVLEVALVRMAQAASLPTLADLLAEVRAGGLGTGGVAGGAAAPQARSGGGGGGTGFRPPPQRTRCSVSFRAAPREWRRQRPAFAPAAAPRRPRAAAGHRREVPRRRPRRQWRRSPHARVRPQDVRGPTRVARGPAGTHDRRAGTRAAARAPRGRAARRRRCSRSRQCRGEQGRGRQGQTRPDRAARARSVRWPRRAGRPTRPRAEPAAEARRTRRRSAAAPGARRAAGELSGRSARGADRDRAGRVRRACGQLGAA